MKPVIDENCLNISVFLFVNCSISQQGYFFQLHGCFYLKKIKNYLNRIRLTNLCQLSVLHWWTINTNISGRTHHNRDVDVH